MSDARALPPARLDVAWTFASSALEGPQGWSTSALRLECSWEADVPAGTKPPVARYSLPLARKLLWMPRRSSKKLALSSKLPNLRLQYKKDAP